MSIPPNTKAHRHLALAMARRLPDDERAQVAALILNEIGLDKTNLRHFLAYLDTGNRDELYYHFEPEAIAQWKDDFDDDDEQCTDTGKPAAESGDCPPAVQGGVRADGDGDGPGMGQGVKANKKGRR